ncbi:hypothetical protein AB0368_30850 [Actinoplanes sp. NPDC051475]|uniref:hypothetical protein n=1 Tax=Actinoplanes sp. NPDC051475 TaxID=3157225 RepID=UPI00344ED1AD
MRRTSSLLLAFLTATVTLVAGAGTAAHAAQAAVKMTFNAAPEPVVKGAPVTLSGRVWIGATGNRSRVSFYFRQSGTAAYAYKGFATATDAGIFTRRFTAETTGTWKAVFAGTAARKNAARLDAVQVIQRRSKEIVRWTGDSAGWQSPTVKVPTVDFKAIVSWSCTEPDFSFLYLTWEGKTNGYEYVGAEKQSGTLTLNGHEGGRLGFFNISTASNCSWTLRVFSGITTVQV